MGASVHLHIWVLKLASEGLVNKVCTLLQWYRETGEGGVLYSQTMYGQTPYLSTYSCTGTSSKSASCGGWPGS